MPAAIYLGLILIFFGGLPVAFFYTDHSLIFALFVLFSPTNVFYSLIVLVKIGAWYSIAAGLILYLLSAALLVILDRTKQRIALLPLATVIIVLTTFVATWDIPEQIAKAAKNTGFECANIARPKNSFRYWDERWAYRNFHAAARDGEDWYNWSFKRASWVQIPHDEVFRKRHFVPPGDCVPPS